MSRSVVVGFVNRRGYSTIIRVKEERKDRKIIRFNPGQPHFIITLPPSPSLSFFPVLSSSYSTQSAFSSTDVITLKTGFPPFQQKKLCKSTFSYYEIVIQCGLFFYNEEPQPVVKCSLTTIFLTFEISNWAWNERYSNSGR
jgi:hypothetical protein